MEHENTILLKKIYKSSKTALDALSAVYNKSRTYELDNFLEKQQIKYFDIAEEANMLLRNMHELPEDVGFLSKFGFLTSLKMEIAINSCPGHIAEVLIEGCVGGVNEMMSYINSLKTIDNDSLELAHILMETEQETIAILQRFL